MRARSLSVVLVAALAASGCAQMSFDRGADRFQGGVGQAASAPLQDLNIQQTEIPAVVIEASHACMTARGLPEVPEV